MCPCFFCILSLPTPSQEHVFFRHRLRVKYNLGSLVSLSDFPKIRGELSLRPAPMHKNAMRKNSIKKEHAPISADGAVVWYASGPISYKRKALPHPPIFHTSQLYSPRHAALLKTPPYKAQTAPRPRRTPSPSSPPRPAARSPAHLAVVAIPDTIPSTIQHGSGDCSYARAT